MLCIILCEENILSFGKTSFPCGDFQLFLRYKKYCFKLCHLLSSCSKPFDEISEISAVFLRLACPLVDANFRIEDHVKEQSSILLVLGDILQYDLSVQNLTSCSKLSFCVKNIICLTALF